ncbi:MAG: hypothetical protein E7404_06150 [Ruminococcaceae bacterium]|nr:hypothetical protein [Oscillospiraceae bacterium]
MKKLLSIILIFVILFSLSACSKTPTNTENVFQTKKIDVVLYDENEYDVAIKNKFIETLDSLFTEEKLTYNVLNAKGNDKTLESIISSIKLDETILVAPIGKEASSAVNKAFNGQIPIFFANINNPVLMGLMSDKTTPSTTTGVISEVPANYIFNNFTNSIGDKPVGHIGVIFNTSEIVPMETVNAFKSYLDLNNYYYTESVVATPLEAQQSASKMLYKAASGSSVTGEQNTISNISKKYENRADGVNLLFLSSDKIIKQAAAGIAEVLEDSDYYVYAASEESVVGKNFISLKPTADSIGETLAQMVNKYFTGTSISSLPCQTASVFEEIKYEKQKSDDTSDDTLDEKSSNSANEAETAQESEETDSSETSEQTSDNEENNDSEE